MGRRVSYSVGVCLIVLLGWLLRFPGDSLGKSNEIVVDCSRSEGSFNRRVLAGIYQCGLGALYRNPGYLDDAVAYLKEIGCPLFLLDHIYDERFGVYRADEKTGEVSYHWEKYDRVVDSLLPVGATLMVKLMPCPPALQTVDPYAPPKDWKAWEELVYETIRHYNVERKTPIRYVEVWNEPDIKGAWQRWDFEDYMKLYEHSRRGALRADPSVKVGGPASAVTRRNRTKTLLKFIRECGKRNLPIDFLSFHVYTKNVSEYRRVPEKAKKYLNHYRGEPPELFLTEWNTKWKREHLGDSRFAAAHAAAAFYEMLEGPLDAATRWYLKEGEWKAFDSSGGLFTKGTLIKAAGNAFLLVNRLGETRLRVKGGDPPRLGCMAGESAAGRVDVLVWNYDAEEKGGEERVSLRIRGLGAKGPLLLRRFLVDESHGNSYAVRDNARIAIVARRRIESAGEIRVGFTLQANALSLVELVPLDQGPPVPLPERFYVSEATEVEVPSRVDP